MSILAVTSLTVAWHTALAAPRFEVRLEPRPELRLTVRDASHNVTEPNPRLHRHLFISEVAVLT